MDALGAIGIARVFAYGGGKMCPMYDPEILPAINMSKEEYKKHTGTSLNHFFEKLLCLPKRLNTNAACGIANERMELMKYYLEKLIAECDLYYFCEYMDVGGRAGDVLFGLSTSGNSENVVRAFEMAQKMGITTIALTGTTPGRMAIADTTIAVPAQTSNSIQEMHLVIDHLICGEVESFFMAVKAFFLDRDDIINEDTGYVSRQEDFHFDGIFGLCRIAISKGYIIIVATNQSGIGRGYYSEAEYQVLTKWMLSRFEDTGVVITDVLHCPTLSGPDRKPNPGMFLTAQRKHGIDMAISVSLGDKERDIQAGRQARVGINILLSTTMGESEADQVIASLKEMESIL